MTSVSPRLEDPDPWHDEDGGGEGGGGDVGGDPGDDNTEVTFSDDEGEVFAANEVIFDDETDGEVFENQSCLDSMLAGKKGCADLAVEAQDNAALLGIFAAGMVYAAPIAAFPAAVAGVGSGAQWLLANRAQECANDPARTDIDVITRYRPVPVRVPKSASSVEAAAYIIAVESLRASRALSAITPCIERYSGARTALIEKQDGARRNLILQCAALVYNSRVAIFHVQAVSIAIANLARRLPLAYSIQEIADAVEHASVDQLVEAFKSRCVVGNKMLDSHRVPQTLRAVESTQLAFVDEVQAGARSPAAMAETLRNAAFPTSAAATSARAFNSLIGTFAQAGK